MTTQSATLAPSRGSRFSTIEFWRFAFTVLVCLYHFEMFFASPHMLPSGSSAVEFFFILAGFLLAKSANRDLSGRTTPVTAREAGAKATDFVKKKLQAFYPVLIIVLVLGFVVYPSMSTSILERLKDLQNSEWELLMLVGTPFGYNDGMAPIVPLWFLTALIVIGYVYTFLIYKNYDFMMFAAPVIGVLFYVYFTLNSTLVLDFYVQMGFFNAGMIRAIAEMSLGMSIFGLYNYFSKKNLGMIWRVVLSLLEVYAVYRLFSLMFYTPLGMDNFRRLIYIMILVMTSSLNVTLLSKLLNRRIWTHLGKISFTMYLCHFNLINLYFQIISSAKIKYGGLAFTSPTAMSMWKFLQDAGGTDSMFKPTAMSPKDMVLYILLVMTVSTLITLYIAFWRKFIIKPAIELYKIKQANIAAALDSKLTREKVNSMISR